MRQRYYFSSGSGWAAELLVVFVVGFLAASLLWLGLWYFRARPAQADAMELQETELVRCLAERNLCTQQNESLQAENLVVGKKLDQALVGWGRCIKSEDARPTEQ